MIKMPLFLLQDIFTNLYRRVRGKRSYICRFAFQNLTFAQKGYTCCSNAAAKGKYSDYNSYKDFHHSTQCQSLRKTVLNGDYSSCPDWCHILVTGDRLPKWSLTRTVVGYGRTYGSFWRRRSEMLGTTPYDTFHVVGEDACDLYCQMCREEIHGNTIEQEHVERCWNELNENLKQLKVVHFGGTGEPLIQERTLNFLNTLTPEMAPNLECVFIITNGLNFTESFWNQLSPFVREKMELQISVDGATKEVYETVRRGGNFDILTKNLSFIKALPLRYFTMSMCVQKGNFMDTRKFIDFARSYNAKPIFGQVFLRPHLACDLPEHEDHQAFLKIIDDPEFSSPDVIDYFINGLRKNL